MGFTSRLVKLDWVVKLLFARGEGSGGGCPLLYPLFLFFLAYSMAQFDQFILRATYTQVAQEIGYGDQGCMRNESFPISKSLSHKTCLEISTETECFGAQENGTFGCKWDYTGQGFDYQILAGPVFIGIYTFAAIPVAAIPTVTGGSWCQILLGISVVFWSACTLLTGFVDSYWQLLVLRFGLGLGQSGCTPFAASLISDYFSEQLRGAALGVYNWGIYTGYSMSFALGNLITQANINGQGWRWVFIIAGIPGIFLGFLIMLTVREPERTKGKNEPGDKDEVRSSCGHLCHIVSSFCRPSILLLCLAGSIRNAAGYVWAYNTQIYYETLGESRGQIASWLSLVPMIGGSIGVLVGGFISDRFAAHGTGPHGRIWVLIMSQILAAPFAAGALVLPPPYAYMSLIPTYIIGEMWVSVTLAVLVELVPAKIKTTSVAVYFFIISNIGGNMPLLVPVLRPAFESWGYTKEAALRFTLLALYPGEYVLGSALFLLTLFVLKRDIAYIQEHLTKSDPPNVEVVAMDKKLPHNPQPDPELEKQGQEQTKM
ncbi:protein spinster homolog 1 isoform X3 [Folsomia candida]|uniref:protein spinster homolog 1 isoform X3 n=1 Tax=Folsomia candida TaxID=158441 RepID=UPI001604D406|nr:protein spinster homolog 1 isoform X3 [Folsomia candida]